MRQTFDICLGTVLRVDRSDLEMPGSSAYRFGCFLGHRVTEGTTSAKKTAVTPYGRVHQTEFFVE
jgi:hypothetical protein